MGLPADVLCVTEVLVSRVRKRMAVDGPRFQQQQNNLAASGTVTRVGGQTRPASPSHPERRQRRDAVRIAKWGRGAWLWSTPRE